MEVLLLVFFSILIVVSCQDIRRMEIKDGCHIAIAVLAAAAILIAPDTDTLSGRDTLCWNNKILF